MYALFVKMTGVGDAIVEKVVTLQDEVRDAKEETS